MNNYDATKRTWEQAKTALEQGDQTTAAKLFFAAAKLYKSAGMPYMQKVCEGWGWYSRSFSVKLDTIENAQAKADFLERSIQAANACLEYDDATDTDLGNLRFRESNKFSAIANIEVKKAKSLSSPLEKATALRRAAEYKLSASQSTKESIDLTPDKGVINSRKGSYFDDRAGSFYYRAWAEEVINNITNAIRLYEKSQEYCEKAMKYYQVALSSDSTSARQANLSAATRFHEKIKQDIANLKPKVIESASEAAIAETAALKIQLMAGEGLVKGLVSPVAVILRNEGKGPASKITVQLSGMLTGELESELQQLNPGHENRIALAVIPTEAGKLKVTAIVQYQDNIIERVELKEEAWVDVAKPNEKREGGATIIHVHGDQIVDPSSLGGGIQKSKTTSEITEKIINERREINLLFESKHGFKLFKPNEMAISDLGRISKDENDFTLRIQSLSSLIDEIDAKPMKKLLKGQCVESGTINILKAFMDECHAGYQDDLIINLRRLMTLRSKKYPVHKDSADLLKILQQMGFDEYPPDWTALWEKCLESYLQSLTLIHECMNE